MSERELVTERGENSRRGSSAEQGLSVTHVGDVAQGTLDRGLGVESQVDLRSRGRACERCVWTLQRGSNVQLGEEKAYRAGRQRAQVVQCNPDAHVLSTSSGIGIS